MIEHMFTEVKILMISLTLGTTELLLVSKESKEHFTKQGEPDKIAQSSVLLIMHFQTTGSPSSVCMHQ